MADIQAMHAIRLAARENPLSETSGITTTSYRPFLDVGSAWVAEDDNAILGFAVADQATASVWALFVAPTAEEAGIGRALHNEILAWASDRGIVQLRLATATGTRAERFYISLGWKTVGHDEHGQVLFVRSLGR